VARQAVTVTLRTDVVLPKQRVMLVAVGPWRERSGQGVLYVRLVRIGPRAVEARLRFPYAGRWALQAFSASGANIIGRDVRVRPQR
jgi:hypothetical protein